MKNVIRFLKLLSIFVIRSFDLLLLDFLCLLKITIAKVKGTYPCLEKPYRRLGMEGSVIGLVRKKHGVEISLKSHSP